MRVFRDCLQRFTVFRVITIGRLFDFVKDSVAAKTFMYAYTHTHTHAAILLTHRQTYLSLSLICTQTK